MIEQLVIAKMFRLVYRQLLKSKCTEVIPKQFISQAQVEVLPVLPKSKG